MEFLTSTLDPVQLIGYFGMACAIISYQCKKNRTYFIFQSMVSVAFSIQFGLLQSWAGMLLNLFSILRGVILALDNKCNKRGYLVLIESCFALSCLTSVIVFDEKIWIAILLLTAQACGTLAMWTRNGKIIRLTQLFCISPLWIINNVYYFSVGGVLCEVFNMLSVIVSFIRFHKTGYDKT